MSVSTVPYKFYKVNVNGNIQYVKNIGFNTPYGYTEVPVEEYNRATGKNETAGQPTEYLNVDGEMWDKSSYERTQAGIASGYTGKTTKLQNGQTVYELKNGTVTATPPPSGTVTDNNPIAYNSPAITTGWVDPATGNATPNGVGVPASEYKATPITATNFQNFNTAGEKYQILNTASMAKYKPSDYSRQSDGSVVLNPGVSPIPGTTKTIGTSAPVNNNQTANTNNNNTSKPREFYKVGQDIYDAATNQKIGSTEWASNWSGRGDVKEIAAPSNSPVVVNQAATDSRAKQALDQWNAQAKAMGFPQDMIDLGASAITAYQGNNWDTNEIINTFNKIKADTIDPYFKELANTAVKDFQTASQNLSSARSIETQKETADASQAVNNAQSNLESKGMTFSGQGVKDLGTGSAYAQAGSSAPVSTPFGGIDPNLLQGTVGQNNRLIATSSAARYAADQQTLGRKAEDYLGTNGASSLGINYSPAGGINQSAKLEQDKQAKYGSTLQQLINNYRTKQQFNS